MVKSLICRRMIRRSSWKKRNEFSPSRTASACNRITLFAVESLSNIVEKTFSLELDLYIPRSLSNERDYVNRVRPSS